MPWLEIILEGERHEQFQAVRVHIVRFTKGLLPDSSVGKESTCNAGDPGLIPGSGRFAGEGKGYSLQYSWASMVAQLVKNPLAMW